MRFGILGTAKIARTALIPAIRRTDHAVAAVASRSDERARAFADEFDIPAAQGTYEGLLSADVDAVYVPLPNGLHAEWTKRAADAGLDVLCEKPLTADADEAREVVTHCRDRGVVLMEAFMYRYHPRTERAFELAREELDGVHAVEAAFKFPLYGRPDDVRLDPDLAGGSLMDVGCYAVSVARGFLGEPNRAYAAAHDSRDCGVDTRLMGVLEYDSGASATVTSSFETPEVQRYRVEAENGWLEAEPGAAFTPGTDPTTLEYVVDGRRGVETFDGVDQYARQVEAFADCVASGTEPRTGGDEAVANMRVLDALAESGRRGEPVAVEGE